MEKRELLHQPVDAIDITRFDAREIIRQYAGSAFQARNLAAAAELYRRMLTDPDCTIILCLAGSLFSAGLKGVVYDLVRHDMIDAIVSTGAVMVDQDFFEAIGFRHYRGTPFSDDAELHRLMIDRIYDTYIDEDELRECDMTVARIADSLAPRPYSSQEFIYEMGRYLDRKGIGEGSVTLECYRRRIPIFIPAFSDCSAGFGLVYHQHRAAGKTCLTIDSARDFLDLTRIKIAAGDTGLLMLGGGVPKNFAQDTTVAAEILGHEVPMHKYAVQITVADERDGGLSGSTLREAHSWGKVESANEQMVFAEATLAFPLLASYAFHTPGCRKRQPRSWISYLKENEG